MKSDRGQLDARLADEQRAPRSGRGLLAGGLLLAGVIGVCVAAGTDSSSQSPDGQSPDLAAADRSRLESLSVTEKEELRRKTEQFERLSDDEKQRLRQLHERIVASPDRARLEQVMLQYHSWLATLAGQERADLLKLPTAEKLQEVKRLVAQQRSQRFRDAVHTPLEPSDVRIILSWLDNYVEQHEAELLATLQEPISRRLRNVQSAELRRKMLLMSLGRREIGVDLPAPKDEDVRKLISQLSPKTQELLKLAPEREQKIKLLQEWVRAAVWSRGMPQVSDETLLRFYREHRDRFSKERQQELDSLPPEMFFQEMRKYYFQQRMFVRPPHRDGDSGGPPPWPPDGPPPWSPDGPPPDFRIDGRGGPDGWRGGEHGPGERGPGERGPGERRGDGFGGGRRFGNPPAAGETPSTEPAGTASEK